MRVRSFPALAAFSFVQALPSRDVSGLVHSQRSAESSSLPNGWTTQGCYTDNVQQRALTLGYTTSSNMTAALCINYCTSRGFNVAGTEYASECYCDYQLHHSKKAPATDCNMPCSGDSTQSCGGPDRLTVFSNGKPAPQEAPGPSGWKSLGCYTDSQTNRALSLYLPGNGNPVSVEQCTSTCSTRGYRYAAVEYGQECFCGNSIGPSGAPAASGCDLACTGNSTELCGGSSRMNLYKKTSTSSTTTVASTSSSSTITTTTTTSSFYFPGGTLASPTIQPWANYNDNQVWNPWANNTSWRSLYARTVQLPDLSLLMTFEDYQTSVQHFWPILRSTDGGVNWNYYSKVVDQVNGWGTWWNPDLYILPRAIGGFPAGTILIAGESLPTDFSQAYIDLYASTDEGKTWTFVSHVVYGPGPEIVTNGDKAIWEPFVTMYDDSLVVVFSDQRDPAHAQKVSLTTSKDLKNWTPQIDIASFPTYTDRPGMGTFAYSPKSQKYVLTFEFCGGPLTGGCPVYYKTADSPLMFPNATAQPIINNGAQDPNGSPYIIYVPNPAATDGSGMFLMNGASQEAVFTINDNLTGNWTSNDVGQWSAYSRQPLIIDTPANSIAGGKKKLFFSNGGNIGCSGSCFNYVADGLVDVPPFPAS